MNFKKRGQLKTVISWLVFISILFMSVFAVNQSLNETNNSMQDEVFAPDVNISLNLTINISEQNLPVVSEKEGEIDQNIVAISEIEEEIIENESIDENGEAIETNESVISDETSQEINQALNMVSEYSKEKKLVFSNIKVLIEDKLYENLTEEIFAINVSNIKIELTIRNIKTSGNINNISIEYFIRKSKSIRELKEIGTRFNLTPSEEKKFELEFSVPEDINENVSSMKFYLKGIGEDNLIYADKSSIKLEFDERVYRDYLDKLEQERLKEIGPQLLTKIGNKKIPDDEWTKKYIERYNNFSDVDFIEIENKSSFTLTNRLINLISVGLNNDEKKILGLIIGNKKYVIHTVICSMKEGACGFRINGIPTKLLYDPLRGGPSSFKLEDGYILKVKYIDFNHCFSSPCDIDLTTVDKADLVIEKES